MRTRTKDPDELDRWLQSWYEPALRTAYLVLGDSTDAEEAVREAFRRLWRFRDAMPAGDALRPWVYRVVVSACGSVTPGGPDRPERGDGNRRLGDSLDGLAGPAPERDERGATTGDAVREALGALPLHLRVPVVLRHYAGLSDREIAVAVRRRTATVRTRLDEGRRLLVADPRLSGSLNAGTGAR